MAVIGFRIVLPARAALWYAHLSACERERSVSRYIERVLLRHLQNNPAVDLSRLPDSKGERHGEEEA